MDKLSGHSPDLTKANIEKIKELFPAVVTEAFDDDGNVVEKVDFDLLRQELSDHVVDGPRERYQLDWPGKRAAAFAANTPIAKTLRPVREESVDFDTTRNLFIEGDNLDALKLLQESYLGKVKLIYIDPPYNTGKDFIYKDNFAQSTEEYLIQSGQVDKEGSRLVANPESNGRFHSDWLSMMYPRLKLARSLLSDDGVLLVSIDDSELLGIQALCHEIFGAGHHVANFVWKSKSGGANDTRLVAVDHEYLVCVTRTTGTGIGLDTESSPTTNYNHMDDRGRFSLERLDKQNLQYSPSLDYDIVGPEGEVYRPSHKNLSQPNAVWRWSKDRVARDFAELVFRDGHVYTKNYEKDATKPRSLLVDDRFGRTRTGSAELRKLGAGLAFDNPKPTKLIRHLVSISTDHDSICLDFFAGSGTTAHAVMALNAQDGGRRRHITVQLDETTDEGSPAAKAEYATIAELARERIRRAGAKIKAEAGLQGQDLDVGFRTLRIDSTNRADVLRSPDDTTQGALTLLEDNIKPDRSGEDLLFGVLIEWGLELSLPIARETVDGNEVFTVDDGALIACFATGIDNDLIRTIAERQPLRAVFRDDAFADDAARINAEQIFKEVAPATEVKVL